ncbi:hypothetical protein MVES_001260 [Malassezia vespertilionis]|uniref:Uncharacterized protein n=1 Tax=Malassezia vespertilionis TaxID=2020962 RepID=A0A2N1JEC5_9BASI|nr:hypothetical protein MVES_001260 [Malassezia vespertilionis]
MLRTRPTIVRSSVLLKNVPRTALPDDVRRLGSASGARVDFLRNAALAPCGEALVSFAEPLRAEMYAAQAGRACVGGAALGARLMTQEDVFQKLRTHYASVPSALYAVLDACTAEPFQTVVLRNLPHLTTAAKLEKKLRRSYALLGKPFEVSRI